MSITYLDLSVFNAFIASNMNLIKTGIDGEKYPVLSSCLSRGKRKTNLLRMLRYMRSHEPLTYYGSLPYFEIPVKYLRVSYGGAAETWQSHIAFFGAVGLLEEVRPGRDTLNAVMAEAYRKAKEEGGKRTRPPTFFSCLEYTPELLTVAEAKAKEYRDAGASFSHFRMDTMRDVEGEKAARIFYQDTRKRSDEAEKARRLILEAIAAAIEAKGYCLKDEAIKAARMHAKRNRKLAAAITKAGEQMKLLCTRNGYQYERSKKAHREAYGIQCGKSIILPPLEPEAPL